MKRFIFLLVLPLFTLPGFAQDPDLFQTWYLYSIELEMEPPVIVANFDPPIAPNLVIDSTLDFNGTGACNTFDGSFELVDPTTFNVLDFDATDDPCGFFEDQFENDYFSFFFPGTTMTAIISDDGNGEQSLQLHGGPFTTLTFRNVPILSTSEIKLINIAITPNPVSEMLFISSEEIIIETIRIYNLHGRLLKDEKAKSTSVDVSTLLPGLYLIEISTAKGSTTEKFVKK